MSTALAILENSQRHSGQVMGLISQQLDANARLNLQKEEFIASQAMRQAQFAEQSRVNDARLQEAAFRNSILSQKWEAEKALLPLKHREAELRLEAAATQQERASIQSAEQSFNSVISPFRSRASAEFAGNRDKNFGHAYLELEGKYKDAMLKGGAPWVQEAFEEDYNDLVSQYEDKPFTTQETFDPEVASLFSALGDTKGRAFYEGKTNPSFSGSMPSVIAGLLTSDDDDDFLKGMQQAAPMLGDERALAVNLGRNGVKFLDAEMDRVNTAMGKIETLIAATDPNEEGYSSLVESRKQMNEQFIGAFKERQRLIKSLSTGEEIEEVKQQQADQAPQTSALQELLNKMSEREGSFDAPAGTDPFNISQQIESNSFKGSLRELEDQFKTKYSRGDGDDIEVNPLGGIADSLIPDSRGNGFLEKPHVFGVSNFFDKKKANTTAIKRVVSQNVSELSNEELISLIQEQPIREIVQKENRDRVSSGQKLKAFSVGKRGFGDKFSDASSRSQGLDLYSIESIEDVLKLIQGEGLSEADKRRNLIDIYSSIVAVAVDDQIQDL